jgi:TRAP-type C4-dicarboxylate transport system substrate-binding protein
VGATVIARKTWETIPAATREVLLKSARAAGEQMKAKGRAEGEQSVEAMKKRGLKVQPVTPQIEAEWRQIAESVYPKIRGHMVPADMFDEVQRLLREYRKR